MSTVAKKTSVRAKASNTKFERAKASKGREISIGGKKVIISNPDKIYWPHEKYTKNDVVEYYNGVFKYILPYLKDRPESLRRNPNGISDQGFFHKDAGENAPEWVTTQKLFSESANKDIDYIICNDKPTLFYLNNLGCIELNPWNSRLKSLDFPDYMVMDIDPSSKNTFDQVIEVANVIHELFESAGISNYCKTSGATGMHVYVPLGAKYDYADVRKFAEQVALAANHHLPDTTTVERSLDKRKGRIYIDYLQNKKGQTLACAYSLRPKEGATVSTPLEWKEVKKGLHPSQFTIKTMVSRLTKKGDLFKPVLGKGINLKSAISKFE
ncbi:MAG: DNA polymerase LigD [Bacteroidetes bacterium]|nr:MAG: DNA polymerase LigD [Bacteroidota bacterium]